MARTRFGNVTFDEIIRDAFEAGFRALDGDLVRPEPRSRKREAATAEPSRETEELGGLATTLP